MAGLLACVSWSRSAFPDNVPSGVEIGTSRLQLRGQPGIGPPANVDFDEGGSLTPFPFRTGVRRHPSTIGRLASFPADPLSIE